MEHALKRVHGQNPLKLTCLLPPCTINSTFAQNSSTDNGTALLYRYTFTEIFTVHTVDGYLSDEVISDLLQGL
jgi:hypothetical protein